MPRARAQTAEAELEETAAQARAPSASPRRSRASKPRAGAEQRDRGGGVAVAEKVDTAAESDEFEVIGRSETPPAAHGSWEAPPAPPVWSYPSGVIAGRDKATIEKNQPLVAPIVPSLGPVGSRRRPLAVVALSVLTLGLYGLVWHHRINTEVGDFDTRMYVRATRSTLAITVPWLIGLLLTLAGATLIVMRQMQVALPFSVPLSTLQEYLLLGGLVVVPYLVLLLPFSVVATVMTLERVRIAEDRAGRPTDVQLRPPETARWLAVPVIGGPILMAITQRRLNQVWELASPTPAARISTY